MKVYGLARLVRDPELKRDANGTPYCTFSLAENEYRDGKQSATYFFDFVAWSTAAENIAKNAKKGMLMHYEGSTKQSRWESEGKKRRKDYYRLDRFRIITNNKGTEN